MHTCITSSYIFSTVLNRMHINVCIYVYIHSKKTIQLLLHTHIHTHIHTYITSPYIFQRPESYAYKYKCMSICIHTYKKKHTAALTYTHTHIHTYTHTCIYAVPLHVFFSILNCPAAHVCIYDVGVCILTGQ